MRTVAAAPRGRRCGSRVARHARFDHAPLRGLRSRPATRGAARLMPLDMSTVEELRRIVGRDHVIANADDLRIFERDASIEGAMPDAVVLPSTTQEVAATMKVA